MQLNTIRMSSTGFMATLILLAMNRPVRAQHVDDIHVGQSGGAVAIHPSGLQPQSEYHSLLRVDDPFPGWSNNEPGFDAATTSENGIAPLSHGQEIWLEVVELDPALLVVASASSVLELPGDSTLLGGHDLHAHLTYFVDENHPDFDSAHCVWRGVFKLKESGGMLLDSPRFSLLFSIVSVREKGDPAAGDFDDDTQVSLIDQAALEICLTSPGSFPTPDDPKFTTCEVDCHNAFDFDDDLDIDLRDFAEFQTIFGS